MINSTLTEQVPFHDLIACFYTFYTKEYGERKLGEIFEKVNRSRKITRFLTETRSRGIKPGVDDYMIVVHSSRYFTLAKAEVICLASVILLQKWDDDVGKQLGISNNIYLNTVFFRLLDKADVMKLHFTNSNFFSEFSNAMDTAIMSYSKVVQEMQSNDKTYSAQYITSYEDPPMPDELMDRLEGLTLDEAFENGIISDIGDTDGNFLLVQEYELGEWFYALIQGYPVRLHLYDKDEFDEKFVGDLIFSFIETGMNTRRFYLMLPSDANQ